MLALSLRTKRLTLTFLSIVFWGTAACFKNTGSKEDDPFLVVSNPQRAVRVYTDRTEKDPNDAAAWHELGAAYLGLSQYDSAISSLEKATQLDPSRADTWAQIGLAYRKRERPGDAAAAYGQALDRSPTSKEYLSSYRELMESQGRHREFVTKIANRVATGTQGTKLLNSIALDYLRSGVVSAAEDAAIASLQLDPKQTDTHLMLARSLERQERYSEAAKSYRSAIELEPNRTEAMIGLGRALLGNGEIDAAEASFQNALTRDPRNVEALQGLIEVYLAKDELSYASSLLHDALRLAPEATALQVAQAELYLKQGHAGQALSVLKMAEVHAPDDPRLLRVTGIALLRSGQPERAIPVLDKAQEVAPGDASILRYRCQALREAGRKAQVESLCKDVVAPEGTVTERTVTRGQRSKGTTYKAPVNRRTRSVRSGTGASSPAKNPKQVAAGLPDALRPSQIPVDTGDADKEGAKAAFLAGQRLFKEAAYYEAQQAFRKATQLDPLNPNYYYNLGVAHATMNEYEMASECFREALTLNPTDVDALYNLGTSFFRLGNYPDAIVAYQHVLKLRVNDKEAYKSMGAAYEALGDLEKAKECYRKGGGQPAMEELD